MFGSTQCLRAGQVVHPVHHGAAGLELIFEAVIKALNQTVGLRVVSCCLCVLDVKQIAQGIPQGGGELGATVAIIEVLNTSNGNDSETKAERSFDLDFVFDIEAKRTCLFQNL
jgi:hypothetical protein